MDIHIMYTHPYTHTYLDTHTYYCRFMMELKKQGLQ